MIGTIASAAVVSVGALAWGAFERNSPLFGRVQRRLPGDDPIAALTFDDGPDPVFIFSGVAAAQLNLHTGKPSRDKALHLLEQLVQRLGEVHT